MRILILTNLFPTPWDPLRGAFNRQQFERLGARHDVCVLTAVDFRERLRGRRGDPGVSGVRSEWFTFVYLPRIGRALHALWWWLSLWCQRAHWLRRNHFDCVLASWGYPDGVAAGWIARQLGIPYVVKLHGSDINVQATFALRRWQIRNCLRHAAAVVTVSRALAERATAIGADPARMQAIYNGVDTKLFAAGSRAQARKRLGLEAAGALVLYVGNLKESKGCMDLVAAFTGVAAARRDASLVFVGAGGCRDALQVYAEAHGCSERVRFTGAMAHALLGDWFRAADVLCLPSWNEGVPNVVLETMASGTPVVATRVGGIPEVVPDFAGILVPAHDRPALTAALLAALAQPWDSRRIAGHAGRFHWEDNIHQLESVLQAAAARTLPSTGADT